MTKRCLRCYVNDALNDGSEEGWNYCKRCIEERARIDDALNEKEKLKGGNEKNGDKIKL